MFTQEHFVFREDLTGKFLRRPNRFIIEAETCDGEIKAHCPNPGRLTEILIPGVELLFERSNAAARKTRYTAVAAIHRNRIVPLVSARANLIAHAFLAERHGAGNIRSEYRIGHSRFDFLIETEPGPILYEVKSCSLSEYGVAMFPDAPTARGRRHLSELAELSRTQLEHGSRGCSAYATRILFIVTHGRPEVFIPHLHTDPEFAVALKDASADASASVGIEAISVTVNRDGSIDEPPMPVDVRLDAADIARRNCGVYLAIAYIGEAQRLETGGLDNLALAPGWYVYAGSAKKNLRQRLSRHESRKKNARWHIDYLTTAADTVRTYPIRTERDLECRLARSIGELSDRNIPGFGSSDCTCPSHLGFFGTDPLGNRDFVDLLVRFRHVYAFGDAIYRREP